MTIPNPCPRKGFLYVHRIGTVISQEAIKPRAQENSPSSEELLGFMAPIRSSNDQISLRWRVDAGQFASGNLRDQSINGWVVARVRR